MYTHVSEVHDLVAVKLGQVVELLFERRARQVGVFQGDAQDADVIVNVLLQDTIPCSPSNTELRERLCKLGRVSYPHVGDEFEVVRQLRLDLLLQVAHHAVVALHLLVQLQDRHLRVVAVATRRHGH